jgi:hypothetical protein
MEELGFESHQGQNIIFFFTASRLELEPTFSSVQWVQETLLSGLR